MRSVSLIAVLALLFGAITASHADGVNLSARITATSPWPEYGGHCAPLLQGELKDILLQNIEASVSFSGRWAQGYLLAGEPVAYRVEQTSPDGEWRTLLRVLRCGNPARGRYFVSALKPVEKTVIIESAPVERTTVVEREVRVPEARTVVDYISVPEIRTITVPACMPPPMIASMQAPRLGAIPVGYTATGDWRALVTASLLLLPGRESQQTCPEPPPPSGECPPGGTPGTEPPPNGGTPGNPSGPIPCPPATDPNRPPDQPTHGTGGQTWDPGPDAPTVADPVIPTQVAGVN